MELGPDLWISLKEVLQALVLDQPGVELLRERLDCLVDLDVGVCQTNADLTGLDGVYVPLKLGSVLLGALTTNEVLGNGRRNLSGGASCCGSAGSGCNHCASE